MGKCDRKYNNDRNIFASHDQNTEETKRKITKRKERKEREENDL